jgi:hypothetical protein
LLPVEVPVEEEMLLQVLEEVLQEQQVGGIILDNQAQEGLKLAVALHGHWQGARPMELWASVVLEVPVITQQAAAVAAVDTMAVAVERQRKTTDQDGLAVAVAALPFLEE